MVGWLSTTVPSLLVRKQFVEQGSLAGVGEAENDDFVLLLGGEPIRP